MTFVIQPLQSYKTIQTVSQKNDYVRKLPPPAVLFVPSPSTSSSSTQLWNVNKVAVVATAAAAPSAGGSSFMSLLLAFIAGGLFFSTITAGFTACYVLGMKNASLAFKLFRIVVRKVWSSFCMACMTAKEALFSPVTTTDTTTTTDTNTTTTLTKMPDTNVTNATAEVKKGKKRWFWKRAYQVWLEELKMTRKTAADGWEAIKMEADFTAAAVGIPGLVPLQYMLDHLYPYSIQTILHDSIRDTLSQMQHKQIKSFHLVQVQSDPSSSPQLLGFRAYNTNNNLENNNNTTTTATDAMAMDIDMVWKPGKDWSIKMEMIVKGTRTKIPVRVTNVQYEGVVRVIAAPLTKRLPGYGALLVSLPSLPKVLTMDVTVAGGQITKFPWLRTELMSAVQKNIQESLLWPKRMVVPTMIPSSPSMKQLLPDTELKSLQLNDPLLQAEHSMRQKQLSKEFGELSQHQNQTLLLQKSNNTILTLSLKEDSNITTTTTIPTNETSMIVIENKKHQPRFAFWKRGPFASRHHDDYPKKKNTTSEFTS